MGSSSPSDPVSCQGANGVNCPPFRVEVSVDNHAMLWTPVDNSKSGMRHHSSRPMRTQGCSAPRTRRSPVDHRTAGGGGRTEPSRRSAPSFAAPSTHLAMYAAGGCVAIATAPTAVSARSASSP